MRSTFLSGMRSGQIEERPPWGLLWLAPRHAEHHRTNRRVLTGLWPSRSATMGHCWWANNSNGHPLTCQIYLISRCKSRPPLLVHWTFDCEGLSFWVLSGLLSKRITGSSHLQLVKRILKAEGARAVARSSPHFFGRIPLRSSSGRCKTGPDAM